MTPTSSPRALMMIGKKSGAIASAVAAIIEPLIMLPNRRIARATVRVISPSRLKGSMSGCGSMYARR
jgi:hypothetical protein